MMSTRNIDRSVMADLTIDVRHDLCTGITVAGLFGVLNLRAARVVRDALTKCVADCPSALIVDLSATDVAMPHALTVFRAASLSQPQLPDVPLLLCVRPQTLDGHFARMSVWPLPVFESIDAATTRVKETTHSMLRVTMPLPAAAESPGRARVCVDAVCRDWGIRHIANDSRLVVSELVTNAVSHAGSGIELELMLRDPFLLVRVRDDSPAEPRLRHGPTSTLGGRGLHLVDLYTSGWGFLHGRGGKVVWATLRTRPIGA